MILLALSTTLVSHAAEAGLVISEVLYDPAGAEPGGEWIELYNTGATPVDLGAYAVGDEETPGQAEMMLVLPALSLPPGEAVVVARDAAQVPAPPGALVVALDNAAPDRTLTAAVASWGGLTWAGLANLGDEVLLLHADGLGGWQVVDGVAWGAGATAVAGVPFLDQAAASGVDGRSLARVDARVDTDRSVDWATQASPTPGVAGPDPCGNGLLNSGEACDDGNDAPGDGCDGDCQIECGFDCADAGPGSCAPRCGDGDRVAGEGCDDGNLLAGDGCDPGCAVEDAWICADPTPLCDEDPLATVSVCALDPCRMALRLTEVHVDGASDPASEWFEVYNAGATVIDLTPWAVGDEETEGGSGEGLLAFPPGAAIAPGEVRVVAASAARFATDFGAQADFEYSGTDPAVPDLAPEAHWTSGAAVSLDDAADEVVLVCRGAIRDLVRWGPPAGGAALPAPSPAYDGSDPGARQTFVRLDPSLPSTAATDWAISHCPTPGAVGLTNAPPDTGRAVALIAPAGGADLYLPGDDPTGDPLVFTVDAAGALGTVTLLDAAAGTVRYTAPAGYTGPDAFTFTVADACTRSVPLPVDVTVATAACDPGVGALRLGEVHVDARVDPVGEWIELRNVGDAPVSLAWLRLGDEETPGGREGLVAFPEGAWIGAHDVVVVAAEAREFELDFGFLPDFEWRRDTDLDPTSDLARYAPWASGTVHLEEAGDEVYLVGCGGEVLDSVYWGVPEAIGYAPAEIPWATRLPSPSPPFAGEAALGPHTFERAPDGANTHSAADWYTQRCPNPGAYGPSDERPLAGPARRALPTGGAVSGTLTGSGPEAQPLVFAVLGAAPSGFVLTSAAVGSYVYTPPPAFTGLTTVAYTIDDGCAASAPATVTFCVGTAEIPGNNVDEDCDGVILCFVDNDHDGWGSYQTVADDGDGECASAGESHLTGDCDDDPAGCGAACSPVQAEVCDGRDNDCDPSSPDGAHDPAVGAACDSTDDADACLDDLRECVGGTLVCVNSPTGDAARVEVCDAANMDEDCDGGADDLDPDGPPDSAPMRWVDRDGDGYGDPTTGARRCDPVAGEVNQGGDCDDDPAGCGAACHPGRVESLAAANCHDGLDNDCDGAPADSDPECFADVTCYPDDDGDGYGRTIDATTLTGPSAGAGCAAWDDGVHAPGYWVAVGGDCDDGPGGCGVGCYPGAAEVCDGQDNDCDPATTDGYDDLLALGGCDAAADADACEDDLPQCSGGVLSCVNNPAGDAARVEVCDAAYTDEDCDGGADDDDPQGSPPGAVTTWTDSDGDGWGDPATARSYCHPPAGRVTRAGDCDDQPASCGAACHPGLTESLGAANCADGWNNDCDGDGADLDGACFGATSCWADADGDGYGDAGTTVVLTGAAAGAGCAGYVDGLHPAGFWVANGLDCADDPNGCGAACAPDRLELCDGEDNDCDPATVDGAGDVRVGAACDAAADADRCFDDRRACVGGGLVCQNDPTFDTQQVEVCDPGNVDEDCDGGANDEDPDGVPAGAPVWFADRDGDTYGDPLSPKVSCARPVGYVANGADCDDNPLTCGASCFPGNVEVCDGLDNDCDAGTVDGANDPAVNVACDSLADDNLCADEVTRCVAGHLTCPDDPVDDAARVERCDPEQVDEDCDGGADDADPDGPPEGAPLWYRDADGDGHGDLTQTVAACTAPTGYVGTSDDCDDDVEACGAACAPGLPESWGAGNCLDGYDNDCEDGADVGGGCAAEVVCWPDFDGDGHGDPATPNTVTGAAAIAGCALWADGVHPVGFWVHNDEDCDDTNDEVHAGRPEVIGDGVDQDCSGADLCWIDRDNDGVAANGAATAEAPTGQSCDEAFGLAAVAGDCDDDPGACGAACRPGALEICDGRDNDCDGETDGAVCDGVVGPSAPILFGGSGCAGGGAGGGAAAALLVMWAAARARRRRRTVGAGA